MNDADKWDRIYRSGGHAGQQAATVLAENLHLLPVSGRALDLACGQGTNALLLARHGLETHAWDISEVVIRKLEAIATDEDINLHPEQRDVVHQPPPAAAFDIIVVSRFLDRQLVPALVDALRQEGLIFYQTFIRDRVDETGPANPEYRLAVNELLTLFSALSIIFYREEGTIGDTTRGFRNEAMLIARKSC